MPAPGVASRSWDEVYPASVKWHVLFGVWLTAAGALAQPTPESELALTYERGAGAETCPEQDSLVALVASRLGRSPFRPEAPAQARVQLSGSEAGFIAQVSLARPSKPLLQRTLKSTGDCAQLLEAIALALSIAVDPHAFNAPAAAAAPAEPAVSAAPPVHLQLAGGALAALGAAPGAAVGAHLQFALRHENLSLALEGRVDLPSRQPAGPGEVNTSFILGTLAPCFHRGMVAACAAFSVGALRVAGQGLTNARSGSAVLALLGPRAQLDLPLTGPLSLRVMGELQAFLTRVTVEVDPNVLWVTPLVTGALSLALSVQLD